MELIIRRLGLDDASAFWALRLKSLKAHPTAYGQSYEEELNAPPERPASFFANTSDENFIAGAILEGKLVGMLWFGREKYLKMRHRATIGMMYVHPKARGIGVGRALLMDTLDRAYDLDGIEEVMIGVAVGNEAARKLYASFGFESHYIDQGEMVVDGVAYDLEMMRLTLKRDENWRGNSGHHHHHPH